MSTKTIVEQLTEAQAAIAAITAERDTFKAAFAASEDQAKHNAETVLKLEADAKTACEFADKTAADLSAKLEAESAAKTAAEKAQAESDSELAKMKAAVASNPAFADAASQGAKPVADVGKATPQTMPLSEYRKLSPIQQASYARAGITLT